MRLLAPIGVLRSRSGRISNEESGKCLPFLRFVDVRSKLQRFISEEDNVDDVARAKRSFFGNSKKSLQRMRFLQDAAQVTGQWQCLLGIRFRVNLATVIIKDYCFERDLSAIQCLRNHGTDMSGMCDELTLSMKAKFFCEQKLFGNMAFP